MSSVAASSIIQKRATPMYCLGRNDLQKFPDKSMYEKHTQQSLPRHITKRWPGNSITVIILGHSMLWMVQQRCRLLTLRLCYASFLAALWNIFDMAWRSTMDQTLVRMWVTSDVYLARWCDPPTVHITIRFDVKKKHESFWIIPK